MVGNFRILLLVCESFQLSCCNNLEFLCLFISPIKANIFFIWIAVSAEMQVWCPWEEKLQDCVQVKFVTWTTKSWICQSPRRTSWRPLASATNLCLRRIWKNTSLGWKSLAHPKLIEIGSFPYTQCIIYPFLIRLNIVCPVVRVWIWLNWPTNQSWVDK